MPKYYIIQNIINFGYWSEIYEEFKGFLYATKYYDKEKAIIVANELEENVTILNIY